MVVFDKGGQGVEAIVLDHYYQVAGFNVKSIDTTGARDLFIGAVLYSLTNKKIVGALEILTFANAVGGLTTTKEGAITAMPTLEEVEEL